MTGATSPTVLIVPGLRDHVREHWQTHLERRLPKAVSVPRRIDGPVVLVAHSAGVMIVAHWALRHRRPIKGALLATPADLESPLPEGYPSQEMLAQNGWTPVPRAALPFPSIVAASTNDPLASVDRVAELAEAWDSLLVNVGAVGHLNPASGFGEWPQAEEFVKGLCASD